MKFTDRTPGIRSNPGKDPLMYVTTLINRFLSNECPKK